MTKEKVIIILCDTLRAKSLPHYGSERNTTPNLNRVIDDDFTVYKRAYTSGPWTPPSHLSLFTGLYPSQVMETKTSFRLNPIFKTLPELFKDSGYKTFAFSTNELISKRLGFAKGFDMFLQLWLPNPESEEILFSLKGDNRFEKLITLLKLLAKGDTRGNALRGVIENLYKTFRTVLKGYTLSTNRAIRLLKQYMSENRDEKVFCFINLMQTHEKYNPPRITRNRFVKHNAKHENYYKKKLSLDDHYAVVPFTGEFLEYLKLRYEEEILYLDIVMSDFIKFLKDNKLYDTCTLIITSDHGEHFGENGHVTHAFSVYEPLIRIPLYIKWYGKSENYSRAKDDLVMLQDLYATFIKLLNHWHPCPDSSYDLTSSDKRPWVVSQLPDMTYAVKGCQKFRETFSLKEIGLEDDGLTAYVFDDGIKIIENGNKLLCYDLKNDPDEKKPFLPSNEQIEAIEKIKNTLV